MRMHTRIRDERGVALVVALMATMLLTALGMAAVLVSNTEGMITANYRRSSEAIYAADAAVEIAVQDLLMVPRWTDVISGGSVGVPYPSSVTGAFVVGSPSAQID